MIILEGPDASGKTTLAKKLGLPYYHFIQESKYTDYLAPLAGLEFLNAVLDRSFISEFAYSKVMNRPFAFSIKEWHNLMLLLLAQNPLIVLCTNKPIPNQYPASQYLPIERWDHCLNLYREFLTTNHIRYICYDYCQNISIDTLLTLESEYRKEMEWWVPMWEAGWGFVGSTYPKFLLVAERQGPNNLNCIPFQSGPTGAMLSSMLSATGTPLGKFAVTNMIKSFRRDTRQVNANDVELLEEEIKHLKPKKVIFMGSPARRGIPVAKALGCEVGTLIHLGSLNYAGIKDMSGYNNEWRKLIGLVPTVSFKEV